MWVCGGLDWLAGGLDWLAGGLDWLAGGLDWLAGGLDWLAGGLGLLRLGGWGRGPAGTLRELSATLSLQRYMIRRN